VRALFTFRTFAITFKAFESYSSVDNHTLAIPSKFEHFSTSGFATAPILLRGKTSHRNTQGQRTFNLHVSQWETRFWYCIAYHPKTKAANVLKFKEVQAIEKPFNSALKFCRIFHRKGG